MKKLFPTIVTVLMSAALCACGGGKTAESTAASSAAVGSTAAEASAESTGNTLEAQPQSGGNLVFGMTQSPKSLDPHADTDAGTRDILFNVYEGLMKQTKDGTMEPAVASDYTVSDDAKVYTYTLRDGITFQDGSHVTADDVKYSLDRYRNAEGNKSSAFSTLVSDVVVKDDHTIEVDLNEPNTEFNTMMDIAIIPQNNADPAKNPIGTGPFYIDMDAWNRDPDAGVTLKKYDGYWQEGLPYLDSVEFKNVKTVDTEFTDLQAGSIDMMRQMTSAQVKTLGENSNYNIETSNMHMVQGLFLNNDVEPLNKKEVRQAICYAIDRDAINTALFDGRSHIVGSHMTPSLTAYYEPEAESVYSYDPAKAKELLAEAGYPNGFDLTITVASIYQQHIDCANIIAAELQAVGINAQVAPAVDWNTWLSDVYKNRNYEATVIAFDGKLDPSSWLKRYTSTAPGDFFNYKSDEYDQTYEKAYNALDENEKAEAYKKCQMILAEDAAAAYIQDPANFVAINKKFAGYTPYATSVEDMSLIYQVQ